ncbi:methyltransferase domain-containing protein [Pontibacillus yanchengensis]|uniref:Methyltransferase domain-containing protein n=1 Tax=Pontibacillus yanchengensis TaxID=462910 RepID=A0A6I5A380_9BACI|nr:class I SAM-dependent methyltransferase [Pontibacillus yanchengensis]MYL32919.1 methyltransferase domain-containing protein [Pontibacillus yanchengensis]
MSNDYLDILAKFGIGGAHPGGLPLTKQIFAMENIHPDMKVLDLGCGTGQTAEYISTTFGCEVTALDNHPLMVQKANNRFDTTSLPVHIVHGDAQNLEFKDFSFDMILAESVIAFTDISKTLAEINRVVKRKGCCLLIEMIANQELEQEIKSTIEEVYGIQHVLTEDQWLDKLHKSGFTNIQVLPTITSLHNTEITDINISNDITLEDYDIWDKHAHITETYASHIGYRVFRCCI